MRVGIIHTASGLMITYHNTQRHEHYLENLPQGGDWREFCATTPVSFLGMHFPGAQVCFQWVRVVSGCIRV